MLLGCDRTTYGCTESIQNHAFPPFPSIFLSQKNSKILMSEVSQGSPVQSRVYISTCPENFDVGLTISSSFLESDS